MYVSDAFVRTSVANQTLTYDVSVTNTSGSSRTVTLTGSLASDSGASFSYPALPQPHGHRGRPLDRQGDGRPGRVEPRHRLVLVAERALPRRATAPSCTRLSVHASTDDGRTSDATVPVRVPGEHARTATYYYLNGVRVNFRGDSLQGADYDRINNGGKGDAYDTLPGFLPPSASNGGWPQAVDNYQRLNYNVVRIHQEPASPYMLDVADEMGLMVIDETAIRGTCSAQDFVAGHDNMVDHARALILRDRNHPAVIRWSQSNEPTSATSTPQQFEQDLYAAMNGNDGTRPISVDTASGLPTGTRT